MTPAKKKVTAKKAPTQAAAEEAALVAGVLPEADRRAPETESAVGQVVQPVALECAGREDETRRLLAIAAHDTGYAQADALKILCSLWGVA